jgi:hypothetical protein
MIFFIMLASLGFAPALVITRAAVWAAQNGRSWGLAAGVTGVEVETGVLND